MFKIRIHVFRSLFLILKRPARLAKALDDRGDSVTQLMSLWACNPPILRATAKTHKKVDVNGLPKSRPIFGAARGLTTPLGEMLSEIIDPIAKARKIQWEAQSTEEVLRQIEETNLKLETEKIEKIAIGSLDVEALYPSISQKDAPRIVA